MSEFFQWWIIGFSLILLLTFSSSPLIVILIDLWNEFRIPKFYVDSKKGYDIPGAGINSENPCATLGFALFHCPQGGKIIVAAGHSETLKHHEKK